jgi:transposase
MNLACSRSEKARLVKRAKIVLGRLDGKRNDAVSHEFEVRPNTVGLWRMRFAAHGIAGVRDQLRPGKPPTNVPPHSSGASARSKALNCDILSSTKAIRH